MTSEGKEQEVQDQEKETRVIAPYIAQTNPPKSYFDFSPLQLCFCLSSGRPHLRKDVVVPRDCIPLV